MTRFLLRRAGLAAFQLFVIGSLVFLLVRLIPGDPARTALGEGADAGQIAQARALLHLDQPAAEQYLGFWTRLLHGDLGTSLISGRTVLQDLPIRLGNTLELVGLALAIALAAGIPLGRASALRAGRRTDHAVTGASVLGLSMPVFVIATLLLLLFSVYWPVLPQQRFVSLWSDPVAHLRLLVLPVLTLAIGATAVITRMTRAAMLETRNADFVRTARATGIAERLVIRRHVLRNSLVPVVNAAGVELATLIGGTVLVETVFGWPGLSSFLINAVSTRDYPVIQGVVLTAAVLVIVVNLAADVVGRIIDPRAEAV